MPQRVTESMGSARYATPASRKRRLWRNLGLGCGAFVLLLFVVGLVLYHQATYIPPEALASPSQAAEASGKAAVEAARNEIEAAAEAARRGQPSEVTISLSDADVTAAFAQSDDLGDVRSPRVQFTDGAILISGLVTWQGRKLYLTVTAVPSVTSDGRARVDLTELRSGRLRLPGSVVERVQREMQAALDEEAKGITLKTIEVRPGRLTLSGIARPTP